MSKLFLVVMKAFAMSTIERVVTWLLDRILTPRETAFRGAHF